LICKILVVLPFHFPLQIASNCIDVPIEGEKLFIQKLIFLILTDA